MKRRHHLYAALLVALSLASCATAPPPTAVTLTYETQPEGAMLFEAGQSLGLAPMTRTYASDGKTSTVRTPLVTAVWPSGAKESYYTILPVGSDRVATINRPAGVPGLQADLDNAKQGAQAREQAQRRATEAALRDQKRSSDRCKRQQAGASLAVQDDC
jgi:hypothetical protein